MKGDVDTPYFFSLYDAALREDASRAGWDLLIDYDLVQDIPGMTFGRPFFCAPWRDGHRGENAPVYALQMDEGPPDVGRLTDILAARLGRAGHVIVGWDFRGSTNGWHLKIRLDPHPTPVEVVALQAILGSDPLRESCNLQRAREVERWAREIGESGTGMGREAVEFWRQRWNVLYQPNPQRKVEP